MTGIYLPASGKTHVVSISPATGIYGDSNFGGSFGVELKQAGFDAILITGKSSQTCYLWINDDEQKIVYSKKLKGKTHLETEKFIKNEIRDEEIKILSIGPAGENLVKFASLQAEWGRNSGRCGMGAVFGSKNLKAIAVRGSKDLPVADIEKLKVISKESFKTLAKHPLFDIWQRQGLMTVIDYLNDAGILPTHNFRDGYFRNAEKINGYEMESKYKIGDSACFACPMTCGNICLVKEGKYAGTVVEGPEYETACMFGSNLGVDNFSAILRANFLCDEYGLDTITCGNLIGALIEVYEAGLISLKELDNLPLKWGEDDNVMKLIEKIAKREGVGNVIAEGAVGIIEKWPQLKTIISEVKGLEQSAYDGRVASSMALAYGTSDIGAHHARAWTIAKEIENGQNWGLEERVDIVIYHQTIRPLFDMLGVCRLPWIELGFSENKYVDFYNAVTSVNYDMNKLMEISKNMYDLTRLINIQYGVTRKDDYPPERVFNLPVQTGPHAGTVLKKEYYEKLLNLYYKKRGWDENGVPSNKVKEKFNDEIFE